MRTNRRKRATDLFPRVTDSIRWWHRVVVAAVAGGLMYLTFPPFHHTWWLAPISLGLLYATMAVGKPSVRSCAGSGFSYGLAFFLLLIPWVGEYVGPVPWIALSAVMAGYLALFGALAAVTMRLRFRPVWFALSWVSVETIRSAFPFGGFPWGRTAFGQVEGWYLPLTSVIGVPGVAFSVALTGAAAVALIIRLLDDRSSVVRNGTALVAVAAVVVPLGLGAVLAVTGSPLTSKSGELDVVAVQGNVPRLGLDFNAQRRAVLDNHTRETLRLAEQVNNGSRTKPDLVLWPENAADVPPTVYPDAAASIRAAVTAVGAPIAFGTWIPGPDGPTNSVLLWSARDGYADAEPSGRYDKHIVQPFGEYLPWRSFFRLFSSYADRAGDFQPGTGPVVLDVPTEKGDVVMGVATCWEVAFDRAAQQSVREGAQFLFVPTNNATFGRTNMSYQQLAMSQVRAVETGRSVVVAATSGVSAMVAPDGSLISSSGIFTPDLLQEKMQLRTGTTLAVRFGPWPQRFVVLLTAVAFLYALRGRTSLDVLAGRRGSATTKEHDGQQAT
ncbi:apolipoprotein N-acyltransferase [Gordonia sp. (in: high G+C Gram-positive bacteria)]|uniref:apolipoprotein N-acyltransferase n=1 Tax=Gordonia sp. (in: high G+C Gram-positive bacteria) TaxID=84139 RepID=UPI003C71A442